MSDTLDVGAVLFNFETSTQPVVFPAPDGREIQIWRFEAWGLSDAFIETVDPFTLDDLREKDPFIAVCRTPFAFSGDLPQDVVQPGLSHIDCLISALRLVKTAWLAAPLRWMSLYVSDHDQVTTSSWSSAWNSGLQAWETGRAIEFGAKDLKEVESLYCAAVDLANAKVTPETKRLDIALRRLNRAAEREDLDDQIVDLMIALEAMYGERADYDAGRRINEQVAIRVSLYLESLKHEQPLMSQVRDWYDMRSWIVHGCEPGGDLSSAVNGLSQIVKRSLRKALMDPESLSRIRSL